MEWISIGKLSDFLEGKMKKIFVKGNELLVVNIGGTIYSIDGICTHEECSLADGFLQSEVVTCPCHLARFNVKNGEVVQNPATGDIIEPERTFKIKVEGQEVFVEI